VRNYKKRIFENNGKKQQLPSGLRASGKTWCVMILLSQKGAIKRREIIGQASPKHAHVIEERFFKKIKVSRGLHFYGNTVEQ